MSVLTPPSHRAGSSAAVPLYYLTIEQAAALLRTGEVSPVELVESHLERIAALDGSLHAFITVTRELALDQARAAEQDIRQGRYRGPLHGIPISYKDVIQTKGVRTTAHSNLLRDWMPQEDAAVVERLRASGAIMLGKNTLHEFAFGSPGSDEPFPAARNPWNVEHMPGSTSSGSAAAVASGMSMAAIGTDTGGSVRHPAAACGIVGMKPTYGRISCSGVLPLAPTMDTVGPLTRTVADNALVLCACTDFQASLGQHVKGGRIGVPRRFVESVEHAPEILAAFEAALRTFRDLGCRIEVVAPEGLVECHDAGTCVINFEAYRYHASTLRDEPQKLGENLRRRLAVAAKVTEPQYKSALQALRTLRSSISAVFETGIDIIVNPARERPAQSMAELRADPLGKRSVALRAYSMTGHPAIALPMGFSKAGLPLAIQIAGPLHRDDEVYRYAHAYEQQSSYCHRRPDL